MTKTQDLGISQLPNGNWCYRFTKTVDGKRVNRKGSKDEAGNPLKTKRAAAVFAFERTGADPELSVLRHVFLHNARHFPHDAVCAGKPRPLLYGTAARHQARNGQGPFLARAHDRGHAGPRLPPVFAPPGKLWGDQKRRRHGSKHCFSGLFSRAARAV